MPPPPAAPPLKKSRRPPAPFGRSLESATDPLLAATSYGSAAGIRNRESGIRNQRPRWSRDRRGVRKPRRFPPPRLRSVAESECHGSSTQQQMRLADRDRAVAFEGCRVVAIERCQGAEVRGAVEVPDFDRVATERVSGRASIAVGTDSNAAVVAQDQRIHLGIGHLDGRAPGTLDRLELPRYFLDVAGVEHVVVAAGDDERHEEREIEHLSTHPS